jgi:hypothetical protein
MATYATFQRRKIKQRRRDLRLPWMVLLVVCVGSAAGVGALIQRFASTDELPLWMAFALTMGGITYALRPYLQGTQYLESSIEAEGWTTSDLRKVLPNAWHVIVGIDFGTQGDVDQIAVGPSGVLVVESKSTDSDRISPEVASRWGGQALDNARRVALLLKHNYGHEVAVRSAIVVTGIQGVELPSQGQGVPVIRRKELKTVMDLLTEGESVLTADKIEAIRAALLDYRGQRAEYDSEMAIGEAFTAV